MTIQIRIRMRPAASAYSRPASITINGSAHTQRPTAIGRLTTSMSRVLSANARSSVLPSSAAMREREGKAAADTVRGSQFSGVSGR